MKLSVQNSNNVAYKIILSPSAHIDEYEAYEWYELQKPGLGEAFLQELAEAYQQIASHPHHYGFIDGRKQLRDYLLHRFPYLVVYRIAQDRIEVIAVHHSRKHPAKRYGRR